MPFNTTVGRLLGALSLVAVSGVSGNAQIRVSWPAPNVNVGNYVSVDQCLAATTRVDSSAVERLLPNDTLPLGAADVFGSLPAEVIETAKQCVTKFTVGKIELKDAVPWIKLYLQAGRDADAKQVAERVRASLPASNDSTKNAKRVQTLFEVANTFLSATPTRLAEGVSFGAEVQGVKTADTWNKRLDLAVLQLNIARIANDTANARKAAEWAVDIPNQLSTTEKQEYGYQVAAPLITQAQQYITQRVALDSLRKSTAAYVTLQKTLAKQIERNDLRVGTKAPAIKGDFWYPAPPTTPIPAPGRVTLILAQGPNEGHFAGHETGAMFRRYQKQFPELQVALAYYTQGFFRNYEPPQPEVESRYINELVLADYGFPGLLAVENAPFWRLPAPDRRRVDTPTPNQTAYGDFFWLVDRDGTIVYYLPKTPSLRLFEREIADLIATLLQR